MWNRLIPLKDTGTLIRHVLVPVPMPVLLFCSQSNTVLNPAVIFDFLLRLVPDKNLDLDPHSDKMLKTIPDVHKTLANTQHWLSLYGMCLSKQGIIFVDSVPETYFFQKQVTVTSPYHNLLFAFIFIEKQHFFPNYNFISKSQCPSLFV